MTINRPLNVFLCTQLWRGFYSLFLSVRHSNQLLVKGALLWFPHMDKTFEYFSLKWDSVVQSLPRALNPRLLNHALWFEPPSGVEVLSATLIKIAGRWMVGQSVSVLPWRYPDINTNMLTHSQKKGKREKKKKHRPSRQTNSLTHNHAAALTGLFE